MQRSVHRYQVERSLRKHNNVFDKSNNFPLGGEGKIDIIHTNWGYKSGCSYNPTIYHTTIGNYTWIAGNCSFGLRDHIHVNFLTGDFVYQNGEHLPPEGIKEYDGYWIKIGSDVWIGEHVIIRRGVEIGDGAIVASGAIVTRSVPPFAIVGGNPARFIKWRFPEDVRSKLISIKWWNWPEEKICKERDKLEELVGFNIREYWNNYSKPQKMINYE